MDSEELRQLAPMEIAELKRQLRENTQVIGRICTHLAVEKIELLHGTDLKKSFAYGLVDEVGEVAIENYETIQNALAMPNCVEWPANATVSPAEVSQEIESAVAGEQNG